MAPLAQLGDVPATQPATAPQVSVPLQTLPSSQSWGPGAQARSVQPALVRQLPLWTSVLGPRAQVSTPLQDMPSLQSESVWQSVSVLHQGPVQGRYCLPSYGWRRRLSAMSRTATPPVPSGPPGTRRMGRTPTRARPAKHPTSLRGPP